MTPDPELDALKAGEAALRSKAAGFRSAANNCSFDKIASWHRRDESRCAFHADTLAALAARLQAESGVTRSELIAAIQSVVSLGRLGLDGLDMDRLAALIARATPPTDAPFADDTAEQSRDEPFGRESKIKPGYFEDDMP